MGWIKTKDQLPEYGKRVLGVATTLGSNREPYVVICTRDRTDEKGDHWHYYDGNQTRSTLDIALWDHLPIAASPKEDK